MSDKPHIVFQVINFFCGIDSTPFNLTSDEKLLLLFLSKHKGAKGIYPSISTLAKELKVDYRNVRRTLQKLEKKRLIFVDRLKGCSNYYQILLPDLSTTQGVHAPTTQNTLRASTPPHPGRPRPRGEGVHALQSDKSNKTKEINQRESALSPFEPDEANSLLAKDFGLNLTEEIQSFVERHTGKKTQYEFGRWLKEGLEYKKRLSKKSTKLHPAHPAQSGTGFASVESQSNSYLSPEESMKRDREYREQRALVTETKLNGVSDGKPNGGSPPDHQSRGNGVRKAKDYLF